MNIYIGEPATPVVDDVVLDDVATQDEVTLDEKLIATVERTINSVQTEHDDDLTKNDEDIEQAISEFTTMTEAISITDL